MPAANAAPLQAVLPLASPRHLRQSPWLAAQLAGGRHDAEKYGLNCWEIKVSRRDFSKKQQRHESITTL